MSKSKKQFFLSKYALQRGIVSIEADVIAEGKFICWEKTEEFPTGGFAHNSRAVKEFHETLEDAVIAATKLKEKRIKSLKVKISKLNKTVKQLNEITFDAHST